MSNISLAQRSETTCDTVSIIAPSYLILNDTTINIYKDTTAIICNKYIVISKKRGYNIYSKLIGQSEKYEMVDKLLQSIIAQSNQDTMLAKRTMMKAEDAYTPYEGKIIRNIKIQVLKPFGATVNDTSLPAVAPWSKALNASHISTRKFVIRNKLLFHENDTINPLELVENTSEITSLPYLQDAAIIVENVSADSVDVIVIAKDKFPWMPLFNYYTIDKFSLYLKQVNMVGLGQMLGAGLMFDNNSKPKVYLSEINYYIDNIYKQVSGALNFNVSNDNEKYQLQLNRDLIPLSIRLGGGTDISKVRENTGIDPKNIIKDAYYMEYMNYKVWASYLFYNDKNHKHEWLRNTYLVPGIGFYKRQYDYRPIVTEDTNSMFQNYTNLIGNIAFAKQKYYRTKYIRDFGKAEYIPYGFQIALIAGYSWMEFMDAPYFGFHLESTTHFADFGYLMTNFQIGSHLSNERLKQGVINLSASYISGIIIKKKYKYRFVADMNYTNGINRITNDLIYIGEDYGFVGINDRAIYGQQRLLLELKTISYTPWYLLGFRVAVFGFCSGVLIGDANVPIFDNQFLSSIGLGIYVKNDFLAFNSFQFRFGYFPSTPSGIPHFGMTFNSVGMFDQIDFLNTKPSIIPYQ